MTTRIADGISVSSLERSVRSWARQLERRGFTIDDIDMLLVTSMELALNWLFVLGIDEEGATP